MPVPVFMNAATICRSSGYRRETPEKSLRKVLKVLAYFAIDFILRLNTCGLLFHVVIREDFRK